FGGGFPDDVPGGQFGAIRDMSLISSSGVSGQAPTQVSNPGEFGHVPDLSLISSNTATAAMDAITNARKKALDEGAFDDETEANVKAPLDENADLPAVAKERADLPAVAQRKGPQLRKQGQLGMGPGGGAPMAGKPPPVMAPQPFGPMERIDEEPQSMP